MFEKKQRKSSDSGEAMTSDRRSSRMRRARRTRRRIGELGVPMLSVHRTPRHIYAQVIALDVGRTIASASTVEREVRDGIEYGGNCAAAAIVGRKIAERSLEAGIERVAFDRSGFKYHGRIQSLADAARDAGLKF